MGRSRASREREELEDEWSEEERWFLYVEVEEYCFRVRWMSFVRRDVEVVERVDVRESAQAIG